MPDVDLTFWGPWIISTALALIFGVDRALAALERIGKLPQRWQQWNRKRVAEILAREQQSAALAALARIEPQLVTIVAQLSENGGESLFDKVGSITGQVASLTGQVEDIASKVEGVAVRVDGLAENVETHVRDAAADTALLRSVDARLAAHEVKTDPLVAQYERDLVERAEREGGMP